MSCSFAPRCRLELDARRVSKAEECTCPGRDRIYIRDIFADHEGQGVAVAQDKLSVQYLWPLAYAERHEQMSFGPGNWQKRQLADVALQDHRAWVSELPLKTYEECLKPVDVPGRGCTFPDHP